MSTLLNSLTTELKERNVDISCFKSIANTPIWIFTCPVIGGFRNSIEQSTLYPLLRRLEKQELVTSSWDTSESRPRKYYVLSEYGLEIFLTVKR